MWSCRLQTAFMTEFLASMNMNSNTKVSANTTLDMRNAYSLLRDVRARKQATTVSAGAVSVTTAGQRVKERKFYTSSDEDIRSLVGEILHSGALEHTGITGGLKTATVVIAGGYGVGCKDNFDRLFDLAALLHGEVGATRAAIDAGFTTHERMIGQTGVSVSPKLYISFGVSGHAQHVSGICGECVKVSVNNDPNAPVNAIADHVVTGDARDVIAKLLTYFKQE